VLADEAQFADSRYAPYKEDLDIDPDMLRKYANARHAWDIREKGCILLGDVRGKYLLDYGCGMGEETIYFATSGAIVTAIDISSLGVEITKRRAAHNSLGNITAFVGDVTATALPSESFEIVHGLGIIHHVGLAAGFREVKRLLKPGGKAVFLEHMENSDFVDWLKGVVGMNEGAYTEEEKPLKWNDCRSYAAEFTRMDLYPFYFFGRLRRYIPWFGRQYVQKIDYAIFKMFPFLRHFGGSVLIYLEK
jgi:SAM-dependent methyltransferase